MAKRVVCLFVIMLMSKWSFAGTKEDRCAELKEKIVIAQTVHNQGEPYTISKMITHIDRKNESETLRLERELDMLELIGCKHIR